MSYEEVQNLINLIPSIQKDLVEDKNARVVQNSYKSILETHNCLDLLTLVKMLYEKKTNTISNNKKPSQIDEKFLDIAENLINEEFSIVLGIPKEDVSVYIRERIDI